MTPITKDLFLFTTPFKMKFLKNGDPEEKEIVLFSDPSLTLHLPLDTRIIKEVFKNPNFNQQLEETKITFDFVEHWVHQPIGKLTLEINLPKNIEIDSWNKDTIAFLAMQYLIVNHKETIFKSHNEFFTFIKNHHGLLNSYLAHNEKNNIDFQQLSTIVENQRQILKEIKRDTDFAFIEDFSTIDSLNIQKIVINILKNEEETLYIYKDTIYLDFLIESVIEFYTQIAKMIIEGFETRETLYSKNYFIDFENNFKAPSDSTYTTLEYLFEAANELKPFLVATKTFKK